MGYYIEVPENKHKAEQLVKIYNAKIIPCPKQFSDVPADKGLMCVVENPLFDAAGFCYNQREFEAFKQPDYIPPQRPRTWLLMDLKQAQELSGYSKYNS